MRTFMQLKGKNGYKKKLLFSIKFYFIFFRFKFKEHLLNVGPKTSRKKAIYFQS